MNYNHSQWFPSDQLTNANDRAKHIGYKSLRQSSSRVSLSNQLVSKHPPALDSQKYWKNHHIIQGDNHHQMFKTSMCLKLSTRYMCFCKFSSNCPEQHVLSQDTHWQLSFHNLVTPGESQVVPPGEKFSETDHDQDHKKSTY